MQNDTVNPAMPYRGPTLTEGIAAASISGVSWAAIFAGAAAAAALAMILVILGFGLGFSVISPWPSTGASVAAIGISTAIWLALTQIIASGMGGYLAGRLRVKWSDVHTDEIYFRDTAHGLLSWAVALLVSMALLGSTLSGIVSTGAKAAGNVASSIVPVAQSAIGATNQDGSSGSFSYFVDTLFRGDQPAGDENRAQSQAEAATILVRGISTGTLDANDKTYLGKLVAQKTGLSQADAEKRVDDVYAQAKQTLEQTKIKAKEVADAARKAAAATALWAFVALLCGAFFASLAAIWGGRRRDSAAFEPVNGRGI